MNVSLFSTRPCPIWDPDVPNNGGGNSGGNNKDNTSEQILSYIQYEKIYNPREDFSNESLETAEENPCATTELSLKNRLSSDTHTSPHSSYLIRMLASINLKDIFFIKQNLLSILMGCPKEQPMYYHDQLDLLNLHLYCLPKDKVKKAYQHFGIFPKDETDPFADRWLEFGINHWTVSDLLLYIKDSRDEGGWEDQGIILIRQQLQIFMNKNPDLTPKQKALLKDIDKELRSVLDYYNGDYQVLEKIALMASFDPSLHPKELNLMVQQLAENNLKAAEIKQGQDIGHFLPGIWPGHVVGIEVRLSDDNTYQIAIANSGGGIGRNHPPETKDGLLTGRFQLISVFETSDREQALACVKNIYLMHQYPEQFADAYTFFDIPKLFYAPLHKLERNDEISPPPRPPQTVGNCFFRGPNEIVLWCLQRQGEDELANAYLDSMFETCRKSSHLYPALQDLLDQQSPYYLEAFPDKKECLAG